jgi:beta-N-acetylhexosaminidase
MRHRTPVRTPLDARQRRLATLILLGLVCSLLLPAPRPSYAQPAPVDVRSILDAMTVADRVGQLFVVSFDGDDPTADTAIAELIRSYRIGGVVLNPANGNFANVDPAGQTATTPAQATRLANQLQALAFDGELSRGNALAPTTDDVVPLDVPDGRGVTLPLFIGANQEGDGFPNSSLWSGFTPLPSAMALGATWNTQDAATIGQITGRELAEVGVNLLMGPSLDVLDQPRPDPQTSLGVRSFGGNPYWVGRLGRAFIGGVHEGSNGRVATIAKHFPGQGSSDRLPENEVPTIQKSAEELTAVELAPFAAAARPGTLGDLLPADAAGFGDATTTADGLQSTHIRYAGLQGSSESVPPISLAPQLGQDLLNSPAFAEWRNSTGGLVMSDELGAPAIRRYYDPTLQDFPYKRIAQDALLAGNDLLWLSRFGLDDNPETELANVKGTIEFFQEKYRSDADFRRRVDAAVLRILAVKSRLYPELDLQNTLVDGTAIAERETTDVAAVAQVARNAVTLLSPSPAELAQRMPTGPGVNDDILIVTDARTGKECADGDCPEFPLIAPDALQQIILRLYQPSGQVSPERINSLTFEQLGATLDGQVSQATADEIDALVDGAEWLVFAMLDTDPTAPGADALRRFLSERPVGREQKRLVAMAYGAPYYLDATDIAKLTAYFAAYGKTEPFLEASTRALFREFTPTGASPVDVDGVNYAVADKLKPDPAQSILLVLPDVRVQMGSNTFTAKVRDTLRVVAGPILDYHGRLVPDNTPVSFKLKQRADQFELPLGESGTVNGFAETSILLERAGDYEVQVRSGDASGSLSLVLNIVDPEQGEAQVAVATPTATPSPLPTETPTATPSPTALATAQPTPTPSATPLPPKPLPPKRVDPGAFSLALLSILAVASATLLVFRATLQVPEKAVRILLLIVACGLAAYLLYGVGVLPGATWLQRELRPWGAALITLLGCAIPLLALWARKELKR